MHFLLRLDAVRELKADCVPSAYLTLATSARSSAVPEVESRPRVSDESVSSVRRYHSPLPSVLCAAIELELTPSIPYRSPVPFNLTVQNEVGME
jgi:hypothetical protein